MRANADLRARVREVHPEVCFYYLASQRPMSHAKKKREGREQRLELLRPAFGTAVDAALADRRRLGCAADDIVDAFVGLWTARRVWAGEAVTIPATPPRDRHGLPMEMVGRDTHSPAPQLLLAPRRRPPRRRVPRGRRRGRVRAKAARAPRRRHRHLHRSHRGGRARAVRVCARDHRRRAAWISRLLPPLGPRPQHPLA